MKQLSKLHQEYKDLESRLRICAEKLWSTLETLDKDGEVEEALNLMSGTSVDVREVPTSPLPADELNPAPSAGTEETVKDNTTTIS